MIDTHSNVKNKKQINKSLKCLAEIVLGQTSLNCRRFGICKMKPTDEEARGKTINFDCMAIISIEEDIGLVIEFLESTISESTFKKYFQDGVFKMGEAFEIPNSIARKIGLIETFTIPPGIWELNDLQLCIPKNQKNLQAA